MRLKSWPSHTSIGDQGIGAIGSLARFAAEWRVGKASDPDGREIPCPHLHIYREGYGDKWAIPAPVDRYPNAEDLLETFEAFMRHCNITEPPRLQGGLY